MGIVFLLDFLTATMEKSPCDCQCSYCTLGVKCSFCPPSQCYTWRTHFILAWGFAVDEALCHPYLAPLHDINEEPVCPTHFSFDFEQPSFTEEHIKELIWRESVKFNPDPARWLIVEDYPHKTARLLKYVPCITSFDRGEEPTIKFRGIWSILELNSYPVGPVKVDGSFICWIPEVL